MSRIWGIYSPANPALASQANLALMYRAMALPASREPTNYVDRARGAALALAYTASFTTSGDDGSETWSEGGRFVVALNGGLAVEGGGSASSGTGRGQALRVAAALEADPRTFPAGLDGVYSLAAWDAVEGTLTVATDHLGSRPIYYFHDEGRRLLAFASELKALLALPFVARQLNMESVAYYLRKGFTVPPHTMIRGVNRLLPDERLVATADGAMRRARYWRMPPAEPGPDSEDYWAPRVREEMTRAMVRVTRGAPDVALFLSGGLDSTALLYCLQQAGVRRLETVTLEYAGGRASDDGARAAVAAARAGVSHRLLTITPSDVTPSLLGEVFRRFDEPIDTVSRGPTQYLLNRAVREAGLSSAVDGSHSEALFGEAIKWPQTRERLEASRASAPGESLIERIMVELDLCFTQAQVDDLMIEPANADPMLRRLVANFTEVLPPAGDFETYYRIRQTMARNSRTGVFGEAVSPIHGVETRSGFADRRLVEFVQAMPPVLRGSETRLPGERKLLRAAFRDVTPMVGDQTEKSARPGLPWWGAFSHLEPLVLSQVARARDSGIFRPAAIDRLLRKYHRRGNERDRQRLWIMFVFQCWYDLTINGHDPFS